MAKGHGKSSATSATKKKHAKRHAGPVDEPTPKEKKPKGKDRGKKKEPKPKIFIAPIKPAPIQPDPLETTGLAHKLPADLLVVLRSFNKKAQPTKIRALEELQSAWVDKCQKESEDGPLVYTLVEMLPVWVRCAVYNNGACFDHNLASSRISPFYTSFSQDPRFDGFVAYISSPNLSCTRPDPLLLT